MLLNVEAGKQPIMYEIQPKVNIVATSARTPQWIRMGLLGQLDGNPIGSAQISV